MPTYILVCADRLALTADRLTERSPLAMVLCSRYGLADAMETVGNRQTCRASLKSI